MDRLFRVLTRQYSYLLFLYNKYYTDVPVLTL
nr:MAG TPA: hypothetical protein [Caudoviricetes sp.]